MREASRLATHLLMLQGGLVSHGPRLAGASRLPLLSLSARGEWVLDAVALPSSGALASAAVGATAASASLVFMAQGSPPPGGAAWTPPPGGPGQWIQKPEGMSPDAQRYQSQVTGAPPGWVYRVSTGPGPRDFVDFDGFRDGFLLEAKGPGYHALLQKMYGKDWFNGVKQMLEQAERQVRASKGVPIQWHFAEQEVTDLLRTAFRKEGLRPIKISHTPSTP